MFSFTSSNRENGLVKCSIEQRTNLLCIEVVRDGAEYGDFIRLSAKQFDRMSRMSPFGEKEWNSNTIPSNHFSVSLQGYRIVCWDGSRNEVVLTIPDLEQIKSYVERHRSHIVATDAPFRSRR